MSRIKTHVNKGDVVEVITGESKGKQGEVLRVIPDKARVVVAGAGMMKKAVKPSPENDNKGGFVEKEASIHISNVKLVTKKEKK
jgi:large subunit ribosomal protein L24